MISTITTAVQKMIRSRSWTGCPAGVDSGTASAAARDTAPRKPAQPAAVRIRHPTRRARCDLRRSISSSRYADRCSQAIRVASTVAATTTAMTSARARDVLVTPRSARGICIPSSTNSPPLIRKVLRSQKARAITREGARITRGPA